MMHHLVAGEAFRGNALAKAAKAIQDHGQELKSAKEAIKLQGVGKGTGGIVRVLPAVPLQ